jgi:hypothetical protein
MSCFIGLSCALADLVSLSLSLSLSPPQGELWRVLSRLSDDMLGPSAQRRC